MVSAALQRALKGLLTPWCCAAARTGDGARATGSGAATTIHVVTNGHAAACQQGAILAGPRLSFFLPWRRGSRLDCRRQRPPGCSNTMRCGPVCVGTGLWHHRSVHTTSPQYVLSTRPWVRACSGIIERCALSRVACAHAQTATPAAVIGTRHSGTALDFRHRCDETAPRRAVSALIVV